MGFKRRILSKYHILLSDPRLFKTNQKTMRMILATIILGISIQTVVSDSSWITWARKFEGDIALTEHQERQLLNATVFNGTERNAIINSNQKWTNNRVPYVFNSQYSEADKNVVRAAIADYSSNTCIDFVERSGESDYIEFVKRGGCWSYVGRIGGKQQVSLSDGCVYKYIVIHELMHAAGFFHEQSRYDRDSYVKVNWGNICCGANSNFNKESSSRIQLLGEPYDLKSIMHYGEYDFSTSYGRLKTIEALDGTSPLGNENGFTQIDINKLNKLYGCSTTTAATTTTTTDATTATTDVTTTAAPDSCEDTFRQCSRWASRRWCTRRSTSIFMMDACPDSCGFCDASACFDVHGRFCSRFARRGYCTDSRYQTWMEQFCASTCNVC